MTDDVPASRRVRLVDWAYTLPVAPLSPYVRMKKAKVSFLKYLNLHDATWSDSDTGRWQAIFEAATQYFATQWWPNAPSPQTSSGIPDIAHVQAACTKNTR